MLAALVARGVRRGRALSGLGVLRGLRSLELSVHLRAERDDHWAAKSLYFDTFLTGDLAASMDLHTYENISSGWFPVSTVTEFHCG